MHGSKCNKKVKWENSESKIFGRCPIVLSWRLDEKWSGSESSSVMSDSLQPHGLYSPCMTNPAQNTGVGSLSLLEGIFPTQGLNPGLPHCRWILYQLNHKGSPSILEWVAYPFSSGSSRPRNRTGVSCIAGGFFTNWAIREAQKLDEGKEIEIVSADYSLEIPLQKQRVRAIGGNKSKIKDTLLCLLKIWERSELFKSWEEWPIERGKWERKEGTVEDATSQKRGIERWELSGKISLDRKKDFFSSKLRRKKKGYVCVWIHWRKCSGKKG